MLIRRNRALTITKTAIWYGIIILPSFASAWFTTSTKPTSKPPPNVRLLILPGFGNNAADYLQPGSLVDSLQQRGWAMENDSNDSVTPQIRVLPLERTDWLQVFWRGAFDVQFWLNTADATRPAFKWYLDCVTDEIQQLCRDDENVRVILMGHSAGGWLGRAALGYCGSSPSEAKDANVKSSSTIDLDRILGLVTLGAPHFPPPPERMDMTRGALRLTHECFPGTHHAPLFYLTVVGDAVQGIQQQTSRPFERTSVQGFAYNSYDAVCGNGNEIGDGVVPVCAAHLPGAVQINLPGIYHSINVPDQWYGSDSVLDQWHMEMLAQMKQRLQTRQRPMVRR